MARFLFLKLTKDSVTFSPDMLVSLAVMLFVLVTNIDSTTEEMEKDKIFETFDGFRLSGHVMELFQTTDEFDCGFRCLRNQYCRSYNSKDTGDSIYGNTICQLNNQTRLTAPDFFKPTPGFTYFGKAVKGWHSSYPGRSCKDILVSKDSVGDGEYWIDPEGNGKSLKVFCDMTTAGGGWLLIYNVVINSSAPVSLTAETTFRGIKNYHSNRMILSPDAMKQLKERLHFTQMRFHCSKPSTQRTFHVLTVANSSGEAVVSFFCLQTNIFPEACGSYKKLDEDNSYLASNCSMWGIENGSYYVGKWGHEGETRLSKFPAFIRYIHHWATADSRFECDDSGPSQIGSWKIFVR